MRKTQEQKIIERVEAMVARLASEERPGAGKRNGATAPPNERLQAAAASGDVIEVRKSLADGADPSSRNAEGETPLIIAARRGRANCARALLPVSDWRAERKSGHTAFGLAASAGDKDTFIALLRGGVDPNERPERAGSTLRLLLSAKLPGPEDDQDRAEMLAAIVGRLDEAQWTERRAAAHGWAAFAADHALGRCAVFLAQNGKGLDQEESSNAALAFWIAKAHQTPEEAASVARSLLPFAKLRAKKTAPLPALLKRLSVWTIKADLPPQLIRPVEAWWMMADEMAAQDPLQLGAKDAWALAKGDVKKLPRLTAMVEAETLRQMLVASARRAPGSTERPIEPSGAKRGPKRV
jgi:hypothetical protein